MRTCPACPREWRRGQICEECAAPLAVARELHKTVLFCDVTGSTALGESIDPEALRVAGTNAFASTMRPT